MAIHALEVMAQEHGHDVVVVPDIPEPTWDVSLLEYAMEHGFYVVTTGHFDDVPLDQIDLAVSIFYGKIIKPRFINKCKEIVNLHNGPLPKYRGVRPINWALKNNETTHGVTIHRITPGVDDGPIFGQVIFPIYPEWEEVGDVYWRALSYGARLFSDIFPLIPWIKPVPQDESCATYYSNQDTPLLLERAGWTREN